MPSACFEAGQIFVKRQKCQISRNVTEQIQWSVVLGQVAQSQASRCHEWRDFKRSQYFRSRKLLPTTTTTLPADDAVSCKL